MRAPPERAAARRVIARISQRVGITFALVAQGRGTWIAFILAHRFLAEEPPPSQARMQARPETAMLTF